jgi:peptide chain release factor 3
LLDEGAVQLFKDREDEGNNGLPLLAAVGQLQFEVVQYRLKAEYQVDSRLDYLTYSIARWANGGWKVVDQADEDGKLYGVNIVKDRWNRPVLLFRNPWKIQQLIEEVPELQLVPWAMPPSTFS